MIVKSGNIPASNTIHVIRTDRGWLAWSPASGEAVRGRNADEAVRSLLNLFTNKGAPFDPSFIPGECEVMDGVESRVRARRSGPLSGAFVKP